MSEEAVDCCEPEHWFDSRVGWPGRHDGGIAGQPKTPCIPFSDDGPNLSIDPAPAAPAGAEGDDDPWGSEAKDQRERSEG